MVGAVWFEQRRYVPWLAGRRGGAARNRGSVQLRVLLLAALRHQGAFNAAFNPDNGPATRAHTEVFGE